jgi:GH15 family glucan-1,4-alpha-glucosidase
LFSKSLDAEDRLYLADECVDNLLLAQDELEGWFVAAPGYGPYGNLVWHRDNAECVLALDMCAASSRRRDIFERTEKALARSFAAIAEKEDGVKKLTEMKVKVSNPGFYDDRFHPHCRLREDGQEVGEPWNNMQYDSVARLVVALSRHIALAGSVEQERFKKGLQVAIAYLFDSIWDQVNGKRWLTVCANEWEEKDEPYMGGPLFSSVVGTIHAASLATKDLQQFFSLPEVGEYTKLTMDMLLGLFSEGENLKMLKRYHESPIGTCSTSLWLLTDYKVFPNDAPMFRKTVSEVVKSLYTETTGDSAEDGVRLVGGLRRYLVPEAGNGVNAFHPDGYWGGQAWLITTAQLSRTMALLGRHDAAETLLKNCLEARDREGRLPEQFDGTFLDLRQHEQWKASTGESTPPPWLAWSHAEALKAWVTLREMDVN